MTTTTHVDLDLVLKVAGELRRLCQRAVKAGVRSPVFKQKSWDAALVHVQDHAAGRQPRLASDAPFYRLLAFVPGRHGAGSTWSVSKRVVSSTDGGSRETQEGAHDSPGRPAVRALWQANPAPEQLAPRPGQIAYCIAVPAGPSPLMPTMIPQPSTK